MNLSSPICSLSCRGGTLSAQARCGVCTVWRLSARARCGVCTVRGLSLHGPGVVCVQCGGTDSLHGPGGVVCVECGDSLYTGPVWCVYSVGTDSLHRPGVVCVQCGDSLYWHWPGVVCVQCGDSLYWHGPGVVCVQCGDSLSTDTGPVWCVYSVGTLSTDTGPVWCVYSVGTLSTQVAVGGKGGGICSGSSWEFGKWRGRCGRWSRSWERRWHCAGRWSARPRGSGMGRPVCPRTTCLPAPPRPAWPSPRTACRQPQGSSPRRPGCSRKHAITWPRDVWSTTGQVSKLVKRTFFGKAFSSTPVNPNSKRWFTTSFLQPLPYLVTP